MANVISEDPRDLIALLEGRNVFIQTHNCPDPDAIASAFALKEFLSHFGIHASICYEGRIEQISATKMLEVFGIHMHSRNYFSQVMKPEDYIILVDSQKNNTNVTDLVGAEVACIDHHPIFNEPNYQYCHIKQCGSCASLIAGYYKKMNIPIRTQVAGALVYGIKIDTLEFTRGVTKVDTEMFDWLCEYTDWKMISKMYNNNMGFDDIKAYASALNSIQVFDRIGFACIDFECPQSLVGIISDFVLALDVVDVAVVYSLNRDGIRFSVRSEISDVHAGRLIHNALNGCGDGGGHPSMGGGFMPQEYVDPNSSKLRYAIHERFMREIYNQLGDNND